MCITGANISATDNKGQTPLELADEYRLELANQLKMFDEDENALDMYNKVIDVLKHHM